MHMKTARYKVNGSIAKCTTVRSDRNKARGRMDTYLEDISNTVS